MEALANLVVALIVAVVTAVVTVALALRRFRSEKTWEKKVQAYERILEALHNSKAFSSEHLDAEQTSREVPAERAAELLARGRAGIDEIRRAVNIGSFLLSVSAMQALTDYLKAVEVDDPNDNWVDYLLRDLAACDKCIPALIAAARKDLGIK